MKLFGVNAISILSFLCSLHFSVQNYTYIVKHISVPIDHFSFVNNYTFSLRYLINDKHWNGDGPIFFYTGNEGDIELFAQNTGFVWEIAPEFGALIVFAEHRYYGKSLPYGNQSFDKPEHVGHLTSTQALADYVYLIDYLQTENKYKLRITARPVVAFGGSYGGMLAAWMRIKYPATIIGAIAASAPIFQFGTLTPCDTFNRIVTDVFRTATPFRCDSKIARSWVALEKITSTEKGRKWLSITWKLCESLKENNVIVLLNWLKEVYGNMAMVNYPYSTNFIDKLPAYPVKVFCYKLLTDVLDIEYDSETLLVELGNALSVYTNYSGSTECLNIFSSSSGQLGEEGWNFQACTELVMPMCSKSYDMFRHEEWNFTKFTQECYVKWKVHVNTEDIAILEYGGKKLQAASNIVFSNGLLDPWAGGGVLKNLSHTVQAYVMPEAAHHLDLRAFNPNDPISVINARNFHRHTIRKWLNEFFIEDNDVYSSIHRHHTDS